MTSKTHPYKNQPGDAFWSRAVGTQYVASDLARHAKFLRQGDRVMSAGSCFAANLVPYLERAGIDYVRTEQPDPSLAALKENFSYRAFTAAYGNIYTARQMRQLVDRSLGLFTPQEDRWHDGQEVIDPFRPGLAYPPRSDAEFDLLTRQHLKCVRAGIEQCTVFVFTLGTTEAWVSKLDGAVFPACPGTIRGTFDPERHIFKNFTVAEVCADLKALIHQLRSINPAVRTILTVSPVPLIATARNTHVVTANTYSKSALRAAVEEVASTESAVMYFPAYEMITGPHAPHDYFEADRRTVSKAAIDAVMSGLLSTPQDETAPRGVDRPDSYAQLSAQIAQMECEEGMLDAAGDSCR